MKRWLLLVVVVILIVAGWFVWDMVLAKNWIYPRVAAKIVERKKIDLERWGFVPTWNLNKESKLEEMDKILFFDLQIGENGRVGTGAELKALSKLKAKIAQNKQELIVVVSLLKDEKIDVFLKDKKNWQNLAEDLQKIKSEYGVEGVNVDMEYQSDPTLILSGEYLNFLKYLKTQELGEVSVDVFGNTLLKSSPEKVRGLFAVADYVVMMGYDFHRPGTQAGPVAPLQAPEGERSIWEIMGATQKTGVEMKKLVLALPLYGYEWETGYATALASMSRLESMSQAEKDAWVKTYDELSQSEIWSKKLGDKEIIIYVENNSSLKAKVQAARLAGLSGVGFWAMGYEGKKWDWAKLWE